MITFNTLPYFPKYCFDLISSSVRDKGNPEQNSKFFRRTLRLSKLINKKDFELGIKYQKIKHTFIIFTTTIIRY